LFGSDACGALALLLLTAEGTNQEFGSLNILEPQPAV
jgi:hypothetical protein